MKEVWKKIKNTNGHYEVSSFGRIRSLDRIVECKNINGRTVKRFYKGKLLKLTESDNGYFLVSIKGKSRHVHRIVAEHFVKNHKKNNTVNHIDCNKTNNHSTNLEWCTQKYNDLHSRMNGLQSSVGENNPRAKLTKDDVINIRLLLNNGVSRKIISEYYNVTTAMVGYIYRRNHWKHV